ncbi:MAG: archaellin/type IV pilin N-terminal domain-containing protein [Thermocladium sp.]
MAPQIRNRRGISNVVATIILIAVAIALAVAVAVWVFGLAGSSAKSATLNVEALGLNIQTNSATLTLVVSNPSSSSIGINGFALGGLTCSFNTPITVPGGIQGATIEITLNAGADSQASGFSGVSPASTLSGSPTQPPSTCTGSVTLTPGVQFSGELTTTSGQTYPFTVSS